MKAITGVSAVLISAFLFVGVGDKLMHWDMFVFALGKNPLIPSILSGAVGGGVIAIEAAVACALLPPSTRRTGLLLGMFLFGFFSIVVALLLWLAPASQCGCSFAAGFDKPTARHLLLNVLIALLCGYLFGTAHRRSPTLNGARVPGAATTTPPTTSHQRSVP
jgi:hypothetical protein